MRKMRARAATTAQSAEAARSRLRTRIFSPIQGASMHEWHTLTGNIQRHPVSPREFCGISATFWFICRAGYRRSRGRYPVLYLHDGQNVFDAATAFGGVEWGVDETAQRLIRDKLIEPLIIVAVANTGEERDPRICADRGRIDSTNGSGAKGCCGVRAISDRRTEAVHRSEISHATRKRNRPVWAALR